MFENARAKVKEFYNKNKPVVTKVVFITVGAMAGVLVVIAMAAITAEPVEESDEPMLKEYTSMDGETMIYNPFEDPATGLSV